RRPLRKSPVRRVPGCRSPERSGDPARHRPERSPSPRRRCLPNLVLPAVRRSRLLDWSRIRLLGVLGWQDTAHPEVYSTDGRRATGRDAGRDPPRSSYPKMAGVTPRPCPLLLLLLLLLVLGSSSSTSRSKSKSRSEPIGHLHYLLGCADLYLGGGSCPHRNWRSPR